MPREPPVMRATREESFLSEGCLGRFVGTSVLYE
jgi:hypothetical protein